MNTEMTTNQPKANIFDLLATRSNKKSCVIATLKDKCEPVPYGTLNIYSAGNGIITDSNGIEIDKTIQCEVLSWNYIYLFTQKVSDDSVILGHSYDNKVIENTGETIQSFLDSNSNCDCKIYTQFVCLHNNQPIVVSISQFGTARFRQHLANLMLEGSGSSMIEVTALSQKLKNKTFTFLDVKVVD